MDQIQFCPADCEFPLLLDCDRRAGPDQPAYSPDLNPIEMAFSKLKAHLRRIGARTFDALFKALGDTCNLFDPQECWNFMKATGYASN